MKNEKLYRSNRRYSLEEIFSIIKHNHDNFVEWLQDYQGVENGTT